MSNILEVLWIECFESISCANRNNVAKNGCFRSQLPTVGKGDV